MSHSKQQKTKQNPYDNNPYNQQQQYPQIKKQPYIINNTNNTNKKVTNEQRLKQVYKKKSTSVKQRQKQRSKQQNIQNNLQQKYYLPITNTNKDQNNNNKQSSSKRYHAYLQSGQQQQQYLQQQHHQPRTTRRLYGQSQQTRKIDVSSNLQMKHHFRRKMPSQLSRDKVMVNQSVTSRKRESVELLQNEMYELNRNINNHSNNNKSGSRKIGQLNEQKMLSSRYNNNNNTNLTNNNSNSTHYQNQMFKIRRSSNNTKKSFSGSLTKKPSNQNIVRQDSKLQTYYKNKNNHNINVTPNNAQIKNQSSSTPRNINIITNNNHYLQQGKKQFKSSNFTQAIKLFQTGKHQLLIQQPSNINTKLQLTYNLALVYLKTHQYQQGLKELQQIIGLNQKYKKTVYLFAVISLRHLGMIQQAIEMANKGLSVFSNGQFVDLIFYRGKLYYQSNNFNNALTDMQHVLSLQKNHTQALYYIAILYHHQQLTTHTISALSSAIYYDQNKHSEMRYQALKLRAKLYLSQGKVKQAKKDLLKVMESNNKSNCCGELYYLMGKVLLRENNVKDALINFEKCLREKVNITTKNSSNITNSKVVPNSPKPTITSIFSTTNTNNNYLIPSLLQICKSKITMRDFYSAYHHINRYKHFVQKIDQNGLQLLSFRYFIQGVVFLMKRKVDDAMLNFERFADVQKKLRERIVQKNIQTKGSLDNHPPSCPFTQEQLLSSFLYFHPIFYLYRGYGFFMQNKHQLAIQDYQQYEKYQQMDKYTTYNMQLAKGINYILCKQFDKANECFNKAGELFAKTQVKKIQPYIYRAITAIQSARMYHLQQEKDTLSNNKTTHNNNSNEQNNQITILQLVFDALKQLDKAYDINDNNSNLLFIRSLIYAYLNKFEQSLDDIIKAISKSQQNIPKYFFFRGMIQSTLQNKKQALNDFNIALNLDNNYQKVYFQRAKIHFQLQNYSKAFQDLDKYSQLFDNQQDEQYHKAALYLVNGIYPMAQQSSELIQDKQHQKYKQLRFHILMKLGKINQAQQLIANDNIKDTYLLKIIRISDNEQYPKEMFINNQQTIINTNVLSPSKIRYFNIVQYYHLLGVAYFHMGQYQRALDEFTIALKECHLRDMESSVNNNRNTIKKVNINKEQTQQQSINLGDKDINCIMYNIFLCHLKLNDLKKAYEVFIKQIMPVDENLQKSQFMANFSHLLFQAMKRGQSNNLSLDIKKNNQINKQQSQDNNQQQHQQQQQPQPITNKNNNNPRLATQDKQQAHVQLFTNHITDMFSKQIIIQMSTFSLRTKLSLLNIQCERLKREYSGKLWPEYMLTWLHVSEVENRPQPPWVKRLSINDQGLVFTDNVQQINIQFQTTQHDQQQQDEQQQDDNQQGQQQQQQGQQDEQGDNNQEQQYGDDNQSSHEVKRRFDPRKFRDQMKLGDSIQRKLNKIVNNNNNNNNRSILE